MPWVSGMVNFFPQRIAELFALTVHVPEAIVRLSLAQMAQFPLAVAVRSPAMVTFVALIHAPPLSSCFVPFSTTDVAAEIDLPE